MRLIVGIEQRFDRTPDGVVWTNGQYPRTFWDRYLDHFDEVRVVSRVRDVPEAGDHVTRVNDQAVVVHPLPHYHGAREYALRAREYRRAVAAAYDADGAVLFRVPSQIYKVVGRKFGLGRRPYAAEVTSDPALVFGAGSVRHPLQRVFRKIYTDDLRRCCQESAAVSYVTERALQSAYPPGANSAAFGISDADLPAAAYVDSPRLAPSKDGELKLIAVGSLDQLYKGPDIAVEAMAILARGGHRVSLDWYGGGRHRDELIARAVELGVNNHVRFPGQLPGNGAIRAVLDGADVFLLPSRSEALPRSLVEAMARGLPCLSTRIGGTAELLDPDDLFEAGSASELAAAVVRLLEHPDRYPLMAQRNLSRSFDFSAQALRGQRREFFEVIQQRSREWSSDKSR